MSKRPEVQWSRIEELFHSALNQPPADRGSWLDQHAGDPAVRREVDSLLNALRQHEKFSAAPTAVAPSLPLDLPSARFGPYDLVRLLGRGGMGAVYLAERADGQFQQTVALKVMAQHLASSEFLRKFQTERQLLALLNHPNVTRLLDGGVSSAGDPYLVMEYVEGKPLDCYCDDRRLDIAARLGLFLAVCEAVDYAHRNLILHRDLKPSNIMVTADGAVKLLDFGTASLMVENREVTSTRARMITPRYASPEQLRGERPSVASDVFSLGVILYELLTGAWPYGNPNSVVGELQRAMQDVMPASPPSAVTEAASSSRSLPRDRLRRLLEGDLSAIALKALENEPSRRYGSVRQFAEDVGRYLKGLPVEARPQTAFYRASKFIRRRWLPIAAAAIFVAGLVTATIVSVKQAQTARTEARKAEKVSQFLNTMLSSGSEYNFDPQKFTVAQMLDSAAPRLEKEWRDDPYIEATLRTSLGSSYSAVQRHDMARAQLEKSRAMFHALGKQSEEANALYWLAVETGDTGLPEDAVRYYRDSLAILDRLGKDAPAQLVFQDKAYLADILSTTLNRNLDEAGKLFAEAIQLARRDLSIPRPGLARAIAMQAGLWMDAGKTAEAEAAFQQAIEIFRQENYTGIATSTPYYNLAILRSRSGDHPGAMLFGRQYYESLLRNLGPDHPRTASARIMLARGRAEAGEVKEAAADALAAMPAARTGLPQLSSALWNPITNVSHILNKAGRFAEAEPYAREEVAIIEHGHLPEIDARRAQSLFELAKALHGQKKDREAIQVLERTLRIYQQLGPVWEKSAQKVGAFLEDARRVSR